MSINAYLIRFQSSDEGTLSKLIILNSNRSSPFECYTIELPWLNNQRNISCIPKGIYLCTKHLSNKFGEVYLVHKVPDRSGILIHSGNVAGDRNKGYHTHSWGCILPGKQIGQLFNQMAVLSSKFTLMRLMEYTQRKPIKLHIMGCVG